MTIDRQLYLVSMGANVIGIVLIIVAISISMELTRVAATFVVFGCWTFVLRVVIRGWA